MKRFGLVVLLALALVVGSISFVSAHGKPSGAAVVPAIDCQHTVWKDMVDGSVDAYGDGTNIREHLYSLRDSTSNSYCGELRAQIAWNMPAGICHYFGTSILTSGGTIVASATSPQNCGNVSSYSVYKTEASGTFYGEGNILNAIAVSITPDWKIN